MNIGELSNRMAALDWDACPSNQDQICGLLLDVIKVDNGGLLDDLTAAMLRDDELLAQAEVNPTLSRLVLFQCPANQTKLRFHEFNPASDARPHDHRWPFGNLIVGGSYVHSLYCRDKETDRLDSSVSYRMSAGDSYAISANAYHQTSILEPTWSFLLQGPATKSTWSRLAENVETYGASPGSNSGKRVLSKDEVKRIVGVMREQARIFREAQLV